VLHAAPPAFELSRIQDEFEVEILVTRGENLRILEDLSTRYPDARCTFTIFDLPWEFRHLNVFGLSYPTPERMYVAARSRIKTATAVISTCHDSPKIAKYIFARGPIFIYQDHGVGDGAYGFEPRLADYDEFLVAGAHHRDRFLEAGLGTPERVHAVGYPKLDARPAPLSAEALGLPRGRKTVLYTPHWRANLTSYVRWGRGVLDHFARSTEYNLIFAPHIMLAHRARRDGYDLDLSDYARYENIHIDLGSKSTVDMTYTGYADIYLGDVSSQIYEYIALGARPAVFLNAHGVSWRGDRDYRCWDFGPVVDRLEDLERALHDAAEAEYLDIQRGRLESYVQQSPEPAGRRAARAVLDAVRRRVERPRAL
jgi:hypothetical protein